MLQFVYVPARITIAQMGLADYRRKRRFARTTEPKGMKSKATAGRQFVIQQHAARRLHFDFRLEMDGVLKSWAVPKGISLDPSEKRLAVHGEYGAGAVIVWDRGEWQPIGDAAKGYRDGNLKFGLVGEKLHGTWALVRMRRKLEDRTDNWLLIKERDNAADPGSGDDIIRERPESV